MGVLNDSDMIYTGANEADSVYKGGELVWENGPRLVQQTVTITEEAYYDEKYPFKGYGKKFSIATSVPASDFGSASETTVNGSPLTLCTRASSSIYLGSSDPSFVGSLERVYVQGASWLLASGFEQHSNGSGGSWWSQIINPFPTRWDGSGTSYVIFEYWM